jgi:hypothetical protein
MGEFAIWHADGTGKTPCPEGYTELEGDMSLYGEGWMPYRGGEEKGGPPQPPRPRITESRRLAIPKIKQGQSGWCYAATSKIIDQYVKGNSLELWQYVQHYQVSQGHAAAATMGKDEIETTYGKLFGVETFRFAKRGPIAIELTEEIIHESLYRNNSPIVLGLGSHSYVMYGYDPKTQQILAWDPIAGDTEYGLSDLAFMFSGGQAEYFYNFM